MPLTSVCRAMVDEVNYSISKVDPKKTIQVGSFRVDSRGNQGTYEVGKFNGLLPFEKINCKSPSIS